MRPGLMIERFGWHSMDKLVKICSIKYSPHLQLSSVYIDNWFRRHCQSAIKWCAEHYPDQVELSRQNFRSVERGDCYIIYYAKFQTQEAYTHFILCNDTKPEETLYG